MQALLELGQSVWLDDLRRRFTRSGGLARMVQQGLRGMTSNPTIFEHAIGSGTDYDDAIAEAASLGKTDLEILERLVIEDVQEAADVFRDVYDASDGTDGFVSIEVSPKIARDTEASVAEARRLWRLVDRPNAMIKIPGTRAGWPAIERCLRDGININVTLLFSLQHYRAVANAYVRALETRLARGQQIDRVASVASLFVSRVDSEVDARVAALGGALEQVRGRTGVANARLVYAEFLELIDSARWRKLAAQGARLQRPLWASTGIKNPAYSDVLYVDSLIGADTISTMPPETLRRFEDHGEVRRTLPGDVGAAQQVMEALCAGGIDFHEVNAKLEREGIEKFERSQDMLLKTIAAKRSFNAA